MLQRLHVCLACLCMLLTVACSNYDFTINDRVVYTPDPLFTDYEVPDQALRECIREAINDNLVTAASQLSAISCTQAGIESLAGISTFSQLEQLTLSSNKIKDIRELEALTVLQVLYLDNNQVIDPVPLYQLPALYRVDLANNPGMLCPPSGSLLRVEHLTLPRQCR
jgi:Leucine-rich repeat (LRR) protein